MSKSMQQQPDSNACFVCGRENSSGLKLEFYEAEGHVETTFTPRAEHQGWPGFVHGGILFAVLDETIGRVGFTVDAYTMSGRIEIRYRQPAPIGRPIRFIGTLVRDRGRALELEGFAQLEDGTVVAEASGLYMRVPPELRGSLQRRIDAGY